jgi:hypothetical protein
MQHAVVKIYLQILTASFAGGPEEDYQNDTQEAGLLASKI